MANAVTPSAARYESETAMRTYDRNNDGKLGVDELEGFHADRLREKRTAKLIVIVAIIVAVIAVVGE